MLIACCQGRTRTHALYRNGNIGTGTRSIKRVFTKLPILTLELWKILLVDIFFVEDTAASGTWARSRHKRPKNYRGVAGMVKSNLLLNFGSFASQKILANIVSIRTHAESKMSPLPVPRCSWCWLSSTFIINITILILLHRSSNSCEIRLLTAVWKLRSIKKYLLKRFVKSTCI